MHITISDDVPFIKVAQLAASINCKLVNDKKGGLVLQPRTKRGNCDTCGDWSSELDAGVCPFCKTRYAIAS